MTRTDPAMELARHLALEAQFLTALIMHAAVHTTKDAFTDVFDPSIIMTDGGALISYHDTTTAEADMVCLDCGQPFGTHYASVTTGITDTGDEITELLCTDCARLGRP